VTRGLRKFHNFYSPNIRFRRECEMGGASSTHGTDEKCVQNFLLECLRGRDLSESQSLDRKIILN
jgi:hypothetical protein